MKDQADRLRQAIDNIKQAQAVNPMNSPSSQERRSARVITVTSGKGGVGKTNITVNLAIALSELGLRVIILDADFGLANIDVLFGIVPQHTLLEVIRNRKNILEILSDGPKNTKFISGGSGVEELVMLDKEQLNKFVEDMSLLDKLADIIIIDTGAGLSDNVMSFVLAADEVLLVTTPEPTSVTDAYALIKLLSVRDRLKRVRLIINRAESAAEAEDVMKKLVLAADRFLGIQLGSAGYLLQDDSVIKAVKLQKPFSLSFPKSQAARSIREISLMLSELQIAGESEQSAGFRGFVNRLAGLLRVQA